MKGPTAVIEPDTFEQPTISQAEYVNQLMQAQPQIRGYVQSLLYERTDVDDVMQEVALVAWNKRNEFDHSRSFEAWVIGIARIRVLKNLQTKKRDRLSFSPELIDGLSTSFDSRPESDSANADALQACVQRLSQKEREAVLHRHAPGMTNRSLAKKLRYSESKLSRWLNRIYMKLTLCVKREQH